MQKIVKKEYTNIMAIKHTFISPIVERQNAAEKAMLEELRSGNFTLENPLVKLNPYFINPLAAVVLFNTEEEVAVTVTVMGKENEPCEYKYDVTGSLCENNDKFAIDRMLPKIDMGDYLVIHDTGAHGFSMGYNYNGKLRSAELLLQEDGSVKMFRRAETPKDYFATFDCFEELGLCK